MSTALRAGPLELEFADGALFYLRCEGREVLRRAYAAVRDGSWGTVPAVLSNLSIDQRTDGFDVRFDCEHKQGPIHFVWKGSITGDAAGRVVFRMDGQALTTFVQNRIGVCVLHPVDECAGHACRVEHGDGTSEDGHFPELISPHQPFFDVRSVAHQIEPGLGVKVTLEGDTFEMEDHRNWCDQSFKTYSRPLAWPRPVSIEAGTRVVQTLTVKLERSSAPLPMVRHGRPTFTVDGTRTFRLPAVGLGLGPSALTPGERTRLASLRPAHVRVNIAPSRAGWRARLDLAAQEAAALGTPLELAMALSPSADRELADVAEALRALRPAVSTYLVLPLEGDATHPQMTRSARARLTAVDPQAIFGAGSNLNFTEVNRVRGSIEGADVVVFPNNPQVHAFDDASLAETPEALPWIAKTARSFCAGRPLVLSAVTFKIPPRPEPHQRPAAEVPPYVDPRQTSRFGAAFTALHLGQMVRAGFSRATYFETTGALGVMAPEGASAPGEAVFPLFHVLADVADFHDGEALATKASHPLSVDGFALRSSGRLRVVLANPTADVQSVRLEGSFDLSRARVRRLNAEMASLAATSPDDFRTPGGALHPRDFVALEPHEVVTLDWSA